jgi:hypothetical protein
VNFASNGELTVAFAVGVTQTTGLLDPVVTVIVLAGDETTVPVEASAACTTIRWLPAARLTFVSNVLVLLCTVPETPSTQSFIYFAVPLYVACTWTGELTVEPFVGLVRLTVSAHNAGTITTLITARKNFRGKAVKRERNLITGPPEQPYVAEL